MAGEGRAEDVEALRRQIEEKERALAAQQALVEELLATTTAAPSQSAIATAARRDSGAAAATRASQASRAGFGKESQKAMEDADEALARQLQQVEEARAVPQWGGRGSRVSAAVAPTTMDADAALALRLQQDEALAAARETERRTRASVADATHDDEEESQQRMESLALDPVWGPIALSPRAASGGAGMGDGRGGPPKPHIILCLSCCPCCVPPFCSAERKVAYRRVLSTSAFILSVIQLGLVAISLTFRGVAPTRVNPMVGPFPDTLDLLQARNTARIIVKYELWRLLTPIFLHAGLVHLLTNVLMQLRLGLYLEVMWGMKAWLLIYFGSGVFASAWSAVLKPETIGVGASGALMGIMGAW
jgi:hypothetical protein